MLKLFRPKKKGKHIFYLYNRAHVRSLDCVFILLVFVISIWKQLREHYPTIFIFGKDLELEQNITFK